MTRRQAGFTLIETMLLIAILCIVAAIVYTSYHSYLSRKNASQAPATQTTTTAPAPQANPQPAS